MKAIITFITLIVILFSIGCKDDKKDDRFKLLIGFGLLSTFNILGSEAV